MSNPLTETAAFRLHNVVVRPQTLELVVDETCRRVEPRVMALLVYLAQRPREVISKEQLLDDLWRGTQVVPEALQRAVSQLRKALNDQPAEPVFIETISKVGYRLLVTPRPADAELPAGQDHSTGRRRLRISPLSLAAAAMALVLATWIAVTWLDGSEAAAPQASPTPGVPSEAPVPQPDD